MPVGNFRFTRIPMDRQLIESISIVEPGVGPYLKPGILECMMHKLPAGITQRREGLGHIIESLMGENVFIDLATKREVRSLKRESAELVHRVLLECASSQGKVKAEDIQEKVYARDVKKMSPILEKVKTPSGKELPPDVQDIIVKLAAQKRVDGGRKKKTMKTRKTRKQTRRRRV